tara:strand:+ start:304 stop:492 length:189 start_codon:yes stop_codon:yes gene_type:complete
MFYKINKESLDPKDRKEVVDMVADYLSKTYGNISSFSFEIVGEFETSSYEYRGKDVNRKEKE